jgi:hypothetical protein
VCAEYIDWTTDSGLSDCTAADYGPAQGNVCKRSIMFQLTHGEACSLDHSISISRIGIYCATMFGPEDCPMGPSIANMDRSSSLHFSVAADRFCSGQRALRINDAITILNYTMSRRYNRSDVHSPLRTFQMNDMIYFLLSIDTAKSLRVHSTQVLAFSTKFSSMGIYLQPGEAAARMLETFDEEGHPLGWDMATQTHAMRMQLNQYFVQNAAGDPLLLLSPGSKSPPMFVQLTFLVAYENIRSRRRRRATALLDHPSEVAPRVDQSVGVFSPAHGGRRRGVRAGSRMHFTSRRFNRLASSKWRPVRRCQDQRLCERGQQMQ